MRRDSALPLVNQAIAKMGTVGRFTERIAQKIWGHSPQTKHAGVFEPGAPIAATPEASHTVRNSACPDEPATFAWE